MKKTLRHWRVLVLVWYLLYQSLVRDDKPCVTTCRQPTRPTDQPVVVPDDRKPSLKARIVHNVTVDGERECAYTQFQVKYGKGVPCLMIAAITTAGQYPTQGQF
jgi:hypothetical protein